MLLIIIITIGFFSHSETVPNGYDNDAVSIALNAECIRQTGQDEYGVKSPLFFRSLDDNKAPLYIYLTSALFSITGPKLYAMKFFSMVLGFLSLVIFLLWLKKDQEIAPILSSERFAFWLFLFALTPWFLVTQRIPQETSLVFVFSSLQILCAYEMIKNKSTLGSLGHGLLVGLGVYAYHNQKILFFGQYFILFVLLFWFKNERSKTKFILVSLMMAIFIASPFLWDLLHERHMIERYSNVKSSTSPVFWLVKSFLNYFRHFNLSNFFILGDLNLRHHHGFGGMLPLTLLPFLLVGIVHGARKLINQESFFWGYAFLLLLFSFVPGAITFEGLPHALRTNCALFPLFLFSLYGATQIKTPWSKTMNLFVSMSLIVFLFSISYYFRSYPEESTKYWNAPHTLLKEKLTQTDEIAPTNHSYLTIMDRWVHVSRHKDYRYCSI